MDDKTVNKVMEDHLKDKGFTSSERKRVLNAYKGEKYDIEDERKKSAKSERKEKRTLRHGTSCIGIITEKVVGKKKVKNVIKEF